MKGKMDFTTRISLGVQAKSKLKLTLMLHLSHAQVIEHDVPGDLVRLRREAVG